MSYLAHLLDFDSSKHPRDDRGRFGTGGAGPSAQKPRSDKVRRALATHKPSSKAKQDVAEANEHEVAKAIGGQKSDDNRPMDVVVGGRHGVEIKTLLDNSNDKITVHPESRRRKEAWASEKRGRTLHTVVLDDRDKFGNKSQHSGHRIYYSRGVGAFRLKSMERVKSFAALRRKLVA